MGARDRLALSALTRAYAASLAPAWLRFRVAAKDPFRATRQRLEALLAANAATAYGRAHRFDRIRGLRAFQDHIPAVDYEALRPWIDRAASGEPNVLTRAPIRIFERSSGSSGGNKLVPYTAPFLAEFGDATNPWLYDLFRRYPALHGTTSYWSISPAARHAERTSGGTPIGFDDDTEYFGPVERWALGRLMSVPGTVARIQDLDAWRFETAKHLLADEQLGLVSVWNPSFLTLIMESIERDLDRLLAELPKQRRRAIEAAIAEHDRIVARAIWPRLALVSCWTDGHARAFVGALARWFEGVRIQPKGLLATEGVVSFPIGDDAVLAVGSHVLEFVDLDAPDRRPLFADRLEVGGRYRPLLTTAGGLVRYRLDDELRCTGYFENTATVRFVGKRDRTSDLVGEKLTAAEVDRAIAASPHEPTFALLAPALEPARYVLYVEGLGAEDAARFAADVEAALGTNHHYAYARDLGQLGGVEAFDIVDGRRRFERALVERGARAGDIKPTHLDHRLFWRDVFKSC